MLNFYYKLLLELIKLPSDYINKVSLINLYFFKKEKLLKAVNNKVSSISSKLSVTINIW